jgi:hypothetical protein
MEMIEIKIPRVMKQFGYGIELPITARREALLKMVQYSGKDSTLFNMSSALFLTKKNGQFRDYGILKADFKFVLRKLKMF